MITVTDNWKALHSKGFLPEAFIEVSYYITEPGLVDDITATGSYNGTYSVPSQIKDFSLRSEPLFATFEKQAWVLNGRYGFRPTSTPYDVGYYSSVLSQADMTFTTNPVLTLTLGSVHTVAIPGISITFAPDRNEWATDFKVRIYNSTELLSETIITENTESFRLVPIEFFAGYDKVEVEIVKWSLPGRYARIMEIALGLKQVYTKGDLFGYEHTSSGSMSSAELPKNSVQFKLDNIDGRWNPANPSGLEQYLVERQTIGVRYGFKVNGTIEWVRAGTFYMSEWDTPSNGIEAIFVARDLLEFMGDAYTGTRNDTLTAIATAALTQSNILSTQYSLSLPAVSVNFSTDTTVYTCAEILQMCANAGECILFQDSTGVLQVKPLPVTLTDYEINPDVSMLHPEFTLSKELKSVSVNNGLGTSTNSGTGEILTVSNPIVTVAGHATDIADWMVATYGGRKTVKGSNYRADPRAEVFDRVTVVSQFATNEVVLTEIKYTFNGAFRGSYEGRVVD